MSKISKKSKMIAAAAFVLGTTALGAGVTHANVLSKKKDDRMTTLIDAIAEKFDLNSSDVESVVLEVMEIQHKEMERKFQEKFMSRIDQAITDGKITREQADLIIAKKDEMKNFMVDFKDLSEDEKKELMKSHRKDLAQWANENNIPDEFLGFDEKGPGMHGPRKGDSLE